MDPLLELSRSHGIPIIEDAAQAIGAVYKGRRAGSMGTFGCFSFFPSKNLGGFGDGGMVTTNDADLAEKVRIMRNQGAKPKYYHKLLGGNFRLDALHAAILRVKLRHLDTWTANRQANADYYSTRFEDLGLADRLVKCPKIAQDRHVFNQYVIQVQNRDALKAHLKEHGIETEIYYPGALHLQECMAHGQFKEGDYPVSERATKEVLALPVFPELYTDQRVHVVQSICEFYQS
jgi:dTDP-4-amino-4,6-dideoxygalactose transaminase